jgi:integrase
MYAANTRRQIRAIVSGVLQQAVLHKAIPTNPVRELERIESPKGSRTAPPRGLTPEERRRLLAHVDTDKSAIRADLPDLVRFALGSGLRIGEICAVRWMDLDLDGIPVVSEHVRLVPVVAVRQNVYPVKGRGLAVHGGKSAMALQIVPLPKLVVDCLSARRHVEDDPTWPVFASAGRDGTPRSTDPCPRPEDHGAAKRALLMPPRRHGVRPWRCAHDISSRSGGRGRHAEGPHWRASTLVRP